MNFIRGLIDLIYPPRCIICNNFLWSQQLSICGKRISLCQDCIDKFTRIDPPFCLTCSKPFQGDSSGNHHCEECLRRAPFYNRLMAPFLFQGELMNAIYDLKYEFKTYVADSLGPLLAEHAIMALDNAGNFIVMPVPLHTKRLRQRGFNQSLLLARYVAKALDVDIDYLSLVRSRFTQPQTGLKKKERQRNVKKAFELKSPHSVKGKNILLVDDVATTGSTLNECARVLKKAGAKKVIALVLARAVIS